MRQQNLMVFLMFFMNVTFSLLAQESPNRYFTAMTADGNELTYIIIDEAEKKVAVGTGEKFAPAMHEPVKGRFTIPDKVNGYTVTQIGAYAFTGCQLDSVIIPEGIEIIAQGAFESCKDLTYVSIPATVKEIGKYAFCAGEKLTTIISHIQDPQNTTMEDPVFDEWVAVDAKQRRMLGYEPTWTFDTYKNATLYVPKGCKEKYQNTEGWNLFTNIVEEDYFSDIHAPSTSSVKASGTYDLTGRPVSTPSKGIYIHNGKKVLVR
jgi:hypothetical protein